MYTRENILDELKEISPTVAGIGNANVYTVPQGYFESFSDDVSIRLSELSFSKINPYSVPSGYFGELPQSLLSIIHNGNEYADAQLSAIPNSNTFSVPEGYFDSLANNILQKIKQGNTTSTVTEEQDEYVSPLLSSISKENIYSIPANYFENINALDTIKGENKKAAPVRKMFSKWSSYAVAASVAAVLFTGAYMFVNKPQVQKPVDKNSPEYAQYTAMKNMDIDKSLAALSDEDISNYLTKEVNNSIYENTSDENFDPDIDNLLKSSSDDEIQQYLDDNPEPKNLHS